MLTVVARHFEVPRRLPGLLKVFCSSFGPIIPITRGPSPIILKFFNKLSAFLFVTTPYRNPYNNPPTFNIVAHNFEVPQRLLLLTTLQLITVAHNFNNFRKFFFSPPQLTEK
jgi:hypothetical protein